MSSSQRTPRSKSMARRLLRRSTTERSCALLGGPAAAGLTGTPGPARLDMASSGAVSGPSMSSASDPNRLSIEMSRAFVKAYRVLTEGTTRPSSIWEMLLAEISNCRASSRTPSPIRSRASRSRPPISSWALVPPSGTTSACGSGTCCAVTAASLLLALVFGLIVS